MSRSLLILPLLALACSNASTDTGSSDGTDGDDGSSDTAAGSDDGGNGSDEGEDGDEEGGDEEGGDEEGGDDGGDEGDDGALVLNELVSDDSETDDWFELYNGTSEEVDLGGFGVTDDLAGGADPWRFEDGTTIGPGTYLVVWANDGDEPEDLETDFKLSGSEGETLSLVDESDAVLDEVAFPGLDEDTAYARLPDGTGDWAISSTPTPGEANE